MVVRLGALISIILGVALWGGEKLQLASAHIGLGFLMTLTILAIGVVGCVRQIFGLGIVAIVLSMLLPVMGFRQFPLLFAPHFGVAQILHVVVVLAALGAVEALNAKIQRT